MKSEDFIITTLGKANVDSPLKHSHNEDSPVYKFVKDDERIIYDTSLEYFMKTRESGKRPVPLKSSFLSRLKPKLQLSPAEDCARV
jgi:hypothetical protein